MKITKPAVTIEVCDYCESDGFLQVCDSCGGKYCLLCQGIIGGCMVSIDVCSKCGSEDKVLDVAEKYAKKIIPIIHKRTQELKKLRRSIKAARKREEKKK